MISIDPGGIAILEVPLIYDEISWTFNLYLGVKVGNKWGFINAYGFKGPALAIEYDSLLTYYDKDKMHVIKDGKRFYVNGNGKVIGGEKTDILTGKLEKVD